MSKKCLETIFSLLTNVFEFQNTIFLHIIVKMYKTVTFLRQNTIKMALSSKLEHFYEDIYE
jgi:hypothetical protein